MTIQSKQLRETELISDAIEKYDVVPFFMEYNYNGKLITGAKWVRNNIMRYRIEADRYSRDEFGFSSGDVIAAGQASRTLEFGEFQKNDAGEMAVVNAVELPIDFIVANFDYSDIINASLLMGKTRASRGLERFTSSELSAPQPTPEPDGQATPK